MSSLSKTVRKIAMSKPVGKVLDSKVGKGIVKVGKAAINVAKAPGRAVVSAVKKEAAIAKKADTKYRKEAPRGAYGK